MAPFSPFVDLLTEIEDPRRAEGKLYRLPHVVLFAILAIVAGANSYRTIHSFINVHLARLRDAFGVKWRKAPAYTTIRGILRQLDPAWQPFLALECSMRLRWLRQSATPSPSHGDGAAWLGLVPRQITTGGRPRLVGIANAAINTFASCWFTVLGQHFLRSRLATPR